jgi:hypothetical protein
VIRIDKEIVGDYVVLTVVCDGLPDKKISVLAESLYDNTTTIEEQEQAAIEDANKRLKVRAYAQRLIEDAK